MKKYLSIVIFATCVAGANAQNVYEIERTSGLDLNGTARYVGMGGAMNALGADMSSMGSNPAAIGMFRRGDVSLTASTQTQKGAISFGSQGKTRASFDQFGLVLPVKLGGQELEFFNFGINYQKSRNIKQFIGTDWVDLYGLTMLNQLATHLDGAAVGFQVENLPEGKEVDFPDYNSIISNGAYDAGLLGFTTDTEGNATSVLYPAKSEAYRYKRANWGHVNSYDLNLSFNILNRFYVGATAGIYDVDMGALLYYEELLQLKPEVSYGVAEQTRLKGTGFDFKFGTIIRPIEDNPFRFGLAIHTPRVLRLTQTKTCDYDTQTPIYTDSPVFTHLSTGAYDYRIRTPWRVQISGATTFSNWLALDAEYELAMYNHTGLSYFNTSYFRDYERYDTDLFIKNEVDYTFRPQHTFRIGAEARFAENFYARIGYNFVTSPFQKEAFLNLPAAESVGKETTITNSTYNATSTDYVNLGATNRISLGIGWHSKHFYADMAYVCQNQKAELYPFDDINLQPYKTDLVRHSALFTFGVKF